MQLGLLSWMAGQACFLLTSGSNHPRDWWKVLLVSGRRSYFHADFLTKTHVEKSSTINMFSSSVCEDLGQSFIINH